MIKLYGGRIRKECRWGRLDSGCMAGPEKKTDFSKHKHYEAPQIKQLQTVAQTCNVGPHCACEPCQGPKVFHTSNICDKPCGSGVNLEIFTQLKSMLFKWLLTGSDPIRFWIKAHLKFTAWVWYKVIEVPSRSWQERQMEQNSKSSVFHSKCAACFRKGLQQRPLCEKSCSTLNHEVATRVEEGHHSSLSEMKSKWKADCQMISTSVSPKCTTAHQSEEQRLTSS